MKTNKHSGFSLIEILLVLAIIGIVMVLGLSISRKSSERAYRNYIYTGYSALQSAIADARNEQKDVSNFDDFVDHIADLMSAKVEEESVFKNIDGRKSNHEHKIVTAPNQIRYKFYDASYRSSHLDGSNIKVIKMTVPNQDSNNENSICIVYAQNSDGGFLTPTVGHNTKGLFDSVCADENGRKLIRDFDTRIDLLAFYLDDGLVGRVHHTTGDATKDDIATGNYRKLFNYKNTHDMFCEMYGNIRLRYIDKDDNRNHTKNSEYFYDTNACTKDNTMQGKGIIRVANPNKVF